jgi:hypothetical protein
MLIYVDQVSERLVYTLDFVFNAHGLSYELTNDKQQFTAATGIKLNYSEWHETSGGVLIPATLLFEEEIDTLLKPLKSSWETTECLAFYGIADPLASIFYVLTRYEEYMPVPRDIHDRFEARKSVQFTHDWLDKQIVERWIEAFFTHYATSYLPVLEKARSKRFIPSFDIDNTFAYQWKEGWRSWLSNAKDTLKKNTARKAERTVVQRGEQTDPYDCYDYLEAVVNEFEETRFFWLLGDMAEFDRNIAWSDPRHQRLIRKFHLAAHLGLHPSYASNRSPYKLKEELSRLEKITDEVVSETRQHFLKLKLPVTYQRLMENGVKRDYTMGYAEEVGFRAGTAHPHFFFDLSQNTRTNFEIVPFAYMDGTLLEYKHCTCEEACSQIDTLMAEIERFGGVFCSIWHNETIAEAGKWQGWRSVFEHTLNRVRTWK